MKIAFTGHRPNKLGGYDDSKNFREKFNSFVTEILKHDDIMNSFRQHNLYFITGMALGVDTWSAKLAIDYRIPYFAFVPFFGQEKVWPKDSQDDYHYLLKNAFRVINVCKPGYAHWKMQRRNEKMVDFCNLLIAVWDGSHGGTMNCIKYAEKVKKKIIIIKP